MARRARQGSEPAEVLSVRSGRAPPTRWRAPCYAERTVPDLGPAVGPLARQRAGGCRRPAALIHRAATQRSSHLRVSASAALGAVLPGLSRCRRTRGPSRPGAVVAESLAANRPDRQAGGASWSGCRAAGSGELRPATGRPRLSSDPWSFQLPARPGVRDAGHGRDGCDRRPPRPTRHEGHVHPDPRGMKAFMPSGLGSVAP
jgi:hypothetical protein